MTTTDTEQLSGWDPADADVERFTEGDCHILARKLNQLTGWPICAFTDDDETSTGHCFNRLPDCRYVDVEGTHKTIKPGRYLCTGMVIRTFTFKQIVDTWGGPHLSNYSYERAKIVAEALTTHPELAKFV